MLSCERRQVGLGLRFSSNNFFHQLFYAAAAHAALSDRSARATDAAFVPIGTGFPATMPTHLWEYTLRSLSDASSAQLAEQTRRLLNGGCTCFDRFYAATHGVSFTTGSRDWFVAFRRSSAFNARHVLGLPARASRAPQDMLFIMRRGSRRIITNAQQVESLVLAAQPRLRVVAFEEISLVEQLAMVSEASVLIGVHGMAIAGFVVHLPADERPTACVEIVPEPDRRSYEWTAIVPKLARVVGVRHLGIMAPHAPGCFIDHLRHVNCSSATCRRDVAKGLRSFAASSVLNCNVTVEANRLLEVIQRAASLTNVHPS